MKTVTFCNGNRTETRSYDEYAPDEDIQSDFETWLADHPGTIGWTVSYDEKEPQ